MARSPLDLVVGIDFGMTGTAVSYAKPGSTQTQNITLWDVDRHQEPGSKVPSMVTYLRDEPKTWGFTARSMRDGPEKTEEFGLGDLSIQPDERQHWHTYKLFKTKLQDAANPEDARRARECVQFYLEQLRIHIEQYSKMKFGLDKGNVKYVFSYPTTWQEGTKTVFESLIERAGYKRVRGQELFLTLNEATAAMAHFLVSPDRVRPSNGDLVLVADIGGATSDVSVCQIEYNDAKAFNNITIKASDPGFNTGATYIDDGYKEKLEALLREDIAKKVANTEAKQTDPAILASWTDEVVRSDLSHFEHQGEYIKQKHGFKGVSDADRLMRKTLVPFHSTTFSLAKVSIPQDEWFEELFDEQCSKVVQQFTDKKERLQRNEAIKYVILAGGLGCSEYVKKYLKREYKQYCPFGIPGFDVVEQPELAVSKGLVQYELSHLRERGIWHCKANVTFGIRQKDAEEVHLLFETDDPVQIGATKTVKMEVDFDTLGKLTTDLQLVWSENKPPEKSLIGKGDKYKSWAKEVQSVRDLTPLIKAAWVHPSPKKKRPYTSKIKLEVEFLHGAMRFSIHGEEKCFELFQSDWHQAAAEGRAPRVSPWWHTVSRRIMKYGIGPAIGLGGLIANLVNE